MSTPQPPSSSPAGSCIFRDPSDTMKDGCSCASDVTADQCKTMGGAFSTDVMYCSATAFPFCADKTGQVNLPRK